MAVAVAHGSQQKTPMMVADVGSRSHQAVAGGGRQRQRQTIERAIERAEEMFAGEKEGEREVGDAGCDQPQRTEVRRHEHQVAEPGEWSPPIPAC